MFFPWKKCLQDFLLFYFLFVKFFRKNFLFMNFFLKGEGDNEEL